MRRRTQLLFVGILCAALATLQSAANAQTAPKTGGKPQPGAKGADGKSPDVKKPDGKKPDGKKKPDGADRLKEMFNRLDDNQDGFLSKQEFGSMARFLGGSRRNGERTAERLFAEADANKDGKLTIDETAQIAGKLAPRFGGKDAPPAVDPVETQVKKQFAALDRDRNGQISETEAKVNKDLKARFKQVDTDLDGALSLEEVVEYVKAQKAEK